MKKALKIILCVALVVLIAAAVVFCFTKINNKKPVKALESFVEQLNNGDFEKAKEYTADETMDTLGLDLQAEDLDMTKQYYKNIKIKVNSITKSKDSAVINVDITNKDLAKVLSNYMTMAQQLALQKISTGATDNDMEQELLNYFNSLFESDEIGDVTNTVDVVVNKVDGQWKVVVDENLRDALLPGLYSLISVFAA